MAGTVELIHLKTVQLILCIKEMLQLGLKGFAMGGIVVVTV